MFEVEILTIHPEVERMSTLVDLVESAVGKEFAEELDRVEVRIRPYGTYDDYKADWLVRITVDDRDLHSSMSERTEAFHLQFREFLTDLDLLDYTGSVSSTVRIIPVTGGVISERWN